MGGTPEGPRQTKPREGRLGASSQIATLTCKMGSGAPRIALGVRQAARWPRAVSMPNSAHGEPWS